MKPISLENLKVYDYYDGPLVSLVKDTCSGQLYLVYFKDTTPNTSEYFMTPINKEEELEPFLKGETSIRNFFKNKKLYNYRITYENLKLPAETFEETTFDNLLADNAIPDDNVYFTDK